MPLCPICIKPHIAAHKQQQEHPVIETMQQILEETKGELEKIDDRY